MQPSPVHGGGAGVVEGCVHSYCSEAGKHGTGVLGPVGIGSGTPVSGGVVVGAGRGQTGKGESRVHGSPGGRGSGGGGPGRRSAAAAVVWARAARRPDRPALRRR